MTSSSDSQAISLASSSSRLRPSWRSWTLGLSPRVTASSFPSVSAHEFHSSPQTTRPSSTSCPTTRWATSSPRSRSLRSRSARRTTTSSRYVGRSWTTRFVAKFNCHQLPTTAPPTSTIYIFFFHHFQLFPHRFVHLLTAEQRPYRASGSGPRSFPHDSGWCLDARDNRADEQKAQASDESGLVVGWPGKSQHVHIDIQADIPHSPEGPLHACSTREITDASSSLPWTTSRPSTRRSRRSSKLSGRWKTWKTRCKMEESGSLWHHVASCVADLHGTIASGDGGTSKPSRLTKSNTSSQPSTPTLAAF